MSGCAGAGPPGQPLRAQLAAKRLNEAAATLFWGEDEETGEPNPAPVYSVEVAPVDEDDPTCMWELFGVKVAAPW